MGSEANASPVSTPACCPIQSDISIRSRLSAKQHDDCQCVSCSWQKSARSRDGLRIALLSLFIVVLLILVLCWHQSTPSAFKAEDLRGNRKMQGMPFSMVSYAEPSSTEKNVSGETLSTPSGFSSTNPLLVSRLLVNIRGHSLGRLKTLLLGNSYRANKYFSID
ncbi:hypothetical protein CLOM_g20399 [Closterium sp. NIES-68]|nr:hypothetical protein CLOM_g20399 [Closterium sp. NIES-68]GJP81691.1 hypothetical protein CLOP_g11832 [Closterium sp. NIES-67]